MEYIDSERVTPDKVGWVLKKALKEGWLRREDSAAIFYDLTYLEARLQRLGRCFPPSTLHALAVKANPLVRVMEWAREVKGLNIGVEAASIGEVWLALQTGYSPGRIVYDSPVKTHEELEMALHEGVHINVDNFSELKRIVGWLAGKNANPPEPQGTRDEEGMPGRFLRGSVGIRINPQVGVGAILESSVAGEYSKFGVPIKTGREALVKAFTTFDWLTGVHLHVGSQGCPMQLLIDGIGILYDFVLRVNEQRKALGFPPVRIMDIGGGLPISYLFETGGPAMEAYGAAIRERAPLLFDESAPFSMITEFGRWIFTHSGWTVSRVEYVKRDPGINTAMLHTGADLFVRECLNPKDWHHQYTLFDAAGNRKEGMDDNPYHLAGPLCFAGDILAKGIRLPRVEEGDFLVVHDTGSYTFSMWSRYNSRQTPRVLGYFKEGEQFMVLKERESREDLFRFWQ